MPNKLLLVPHFGLKPSETQSFILIQKTKNPKFGFFVKFLGFTTTLRITEAEVEICYS